MNSNESDSESNHSENPQPLKFGFVGAGRMAQALAKGIASTAIDPDSANLERQPDGKTTHKATIGFFDPSQQARETFQSVCPNAVSYDTPADMLRNSNVIVLAVKPQTMPTALQQIQPSVTPEHLFVSVAAGISIDSIRRELNSDRIIRVMPNTPCLIGMGMSAMATMQGKKSQPVSDLDCQLIRDRLLGAVGKVIQIKESAMDAVTGLSGSGPAYVFTFIESLIRGGVENGLEPAVAKQLTLQTILGATEMVARLDASPSELRRQVTSPGGTTLAGLEALEQNHFAETVAQAVTAATQRSVELSKSP